MAVPLVEGLVRRLGKTEIGDVAEALLHAVILVCLEKLQGAQDSKLVRAFGPELVLSAFAAGNGKQGYLSALAARFQREHAAIFVVGMGGDLHQAGGGLELGEKLGQVQRAAVFRQWPCIRLRTGNKQEEQADAGACLADEL